MSQVLTKPILLTNPSDTILKGCRESNLNSQEQLYKHCYPDMIKVKATAIVFNLFIYEGYTHKQIAENLGISEGTSKWHVNEGRKLLKTKLENFSFPESNQNKKL